MTTLPATTDDIILDELSPMDMMRYARTCKTAHAAVHSYMGRTFRIDKLLARYFNDEEIIEFRDLQYHTGTLISGSTALQFFDRKTYPDSDLDLYAEHRFAREVVSWLLKAGFKYTPLPQSANPATLEQAFEQNPPDRELVPHGMIEERIFFRNEDNNYPKAPWVFNFEKKKPHRKIQLITSLQTPLLRIFKFHSTCVMNVITHDKAYSLFPKLTFVERLSIVRRTYRNYHQNLAIRKYLDRGWRAVTLPSFDSTRRNRPAPPSLDAGPRHVGDELCWTIPLYPIIPLRESYIENNSWTTKAYSWHLLENFWMSCSILVTKKLKFSYLVDDEDPDLRDLVLQLIVPSFGDVPEHVEVQDDKLQLLIKEYRADKENLRTMVDRLEEEEPPLSDFDPADVSPDSDYD